MSKSILGTVVTVCAAMAFLTACSHKERPFQIKGLNVDMTRQELKASLESLGAECMLGNNLVKGIPQVLCSTSNCIEQSNPDVCKVYGNDNKLTVAGQPVNIVHALSQVDNGKLIEMKLHLRSREHAEIVAKAFREKFGPYTESNIISKNEALANWGRSGFVRWKDGAYQLSVFIDHPSIKIEAVREYESNAQVSDEDIKDI